MNIDLGIVQDFRREGHKENLHMWNEGERVSRHITWGFVALIGVLALATVVGTAVCCGFAAAANVLVTVLLVPAVFIAFGLVANGVIIGALALAIIGALALVVKTFRFLFHTNRC